MPSTTQALVLRVKAFLTTHCHLAEGGLLYVALSGGADSVALLHMMRRLGYDCRALHCNFHLRGDESDRDEAHCRQLCQRLDVPLEVRHFDTHAYMQQHHMSLEMAARELRYQWWASRPQGTWLAMGHHQDDSLETLLMNLMRGTGIHGMTGIVPRNELTHVVRPLLCLSRQDVLHYVAAEGLSYVTDSSNLDTITLRNRIRLEVLPLLEQLQPQARRGIASTLQHLADTATLAEAYVAEWRQGHAERRCIDGFCYEVVARAALPDAETTTEPPLLYALRQHYLQQGWDLSYSTPRHLVAVAPGQSWPTKPVASATIPPETIDSDSVALPLTWRRWQQGDRIDPLGLEGHSRLVSDVFSDAHLLPIEKQLHWIVADAHGRIVWLPGLRLSHHVRLTPATRHPLTLHYGESAGDKE